MKNKILSYLVCGTLILSICLICWYVDARDDDKLKNEWSDVVTQIEKLEDEKSYFREMGVDDVDNISYYEEELSRLYAQKEALDKAIWRDDWKGNSEGSEWWEQNSQNWWNGDWQQGVWWEEYEEVEVSYEELTDKMNEWYKCEWQGWDTYKCTKGEPKQDTEDSGQGAEEGDQEENDQNSNAKEEECPDWCCGIKLNTNFPIIWNCIETKGEKANPTNAFPYMIWAITKIVMSLIMVICFILVIVAGIMRAWDKPKEWKELLKKVAVAILLLWFAWVILRLINPTFFS